MPPPPDPIAFTIPGIDRPVFWYGILVTLGTLAGAFVADRLARRRGHNPDRVWDALILVMIFGLIGARLYHVFSSPAGSDTSLQHYLERPLDIINFWSSGLRGLGIYGAVAGGAFGLATYVWAVNNRVTYRIGLAVRRLRLRLRLGRRASLEAAIARAEANPPTERLRLVDWLDICVVGVPLGQAIGRWGNYVNQELYGGPTNVPWAVPIEAIHRLPEYAQLPASQGFHPTFLYESLWNLLAFFVLIYVANHWDDITRPGDLALMYLFLYPLGRFFVEYQRPDAWTAAGVPVAQILSVLLMTGASLAILARHNAFGALRARGART